MTGKILRFGDKGTSPLMETIPRTMKSNASTALDRGRATKSSSEERRDIASTAARPYDMTPNVKLRGAPLLARPSRTPC